LNFMGIVGFCENGSTNHAVVPRNLSASTIERSAE
jgi:hypothetical protein